MNDLSGAGGRRGERDQLTVLPPELVPMTAEERNRAVVVIARVLAELAVSPVPPGTTADRRRRVAAPDGGWPSGAGSS